MEPLDRKCINGLPSGRLFIYLFVHLQSEEMQLKRKKENNESQALPPPVPPKLKPQFYPMVNLLQSDVMIYLMELVLSRAAAVKSKSLSETQLERVRTVTNGWTDSKDVQTTAKCQI